MRTAWRWLPVNDECVCVCFASILFSSLILYLLTLSTELQTVESQTCNLDVANIDIMHLLYVQAMIWMMMAYADIAASSSLGLLLRQALPLPTVDQV